MYNADVELIDLYFLGMKHSGLSPQTWKNRISVTKREGKYVEMLSLKAARDKYKLWVELESKGEVSRW